MCVACGVPAPHDPGANWLSNLANGLVLASPLLLMKARAIGRAVRAAAERFADTILSL